MSHIYFLLGKTTWEAFKFETGEGYKGRKRRLSDISHCLHGGDAIFDALLSKDRVEWFAQSCLPRKWVQLWFTRFGQENPDGVEIWLDDFVSYFDGAMPGTPGWKHGNRGQAINYRPNPTIWELADRFLPELYEPSNLKEVFGDLYEPYIKKRIELLPGEIFKARLSGEELAREALRYPLPEIEAPEVPLYIGSKPSGLVKMADKILDYLQRNMPRM